MLLHAYCVTALQAHLSPAGLPNDACRVLSYPRSWVARDNTLRGGWVASNFQTADKVTRGGHASFVVAGPHIA